MDTESILREIIGYCEANQNPEVVKKYARYFKEGYDAYGVASGLTESKAKEIILREKPSFAEVGDLAAGLVKESKYELPFFALVIFRQFKKEYSKESFHQISAWFDTGINNWAHCDAVCMELMKAHIQKKIIGPADLEPWRVSERPYKRRASLVSMIYAMKDGLPPADVITFTEPLMTDPARVVHQGAGWLLRETWKKHPQDVENLLMKWKNVSPRLIFQYATEKMEKEERKRFRKS